MSIQSCLLRLQEGAFAMKFKEILEGKEYKLIECRLLLDEEYNSDILFGYCQYVNGRLISLDGDTYSLDGEIDSYEVTVATEPIFSHQGAPVPILLPGDPYLCVWEKYYGLPDV